MGLVKVQLPPGLNNQTTQVAASGNWFDGNLIRWRSGLLEKLAGWLRLLPDPFAHFIRRMHAWLDLEDRKGLLVGTDKGLELAVDGTRYVLVESVELPDPRQSTWFLDNLGENGLAQTTHGRLLVYKPPPLDPPGDPPTADPVLTAPSTGHGMFVAMPQAQVILWGSEPILDSGVIDPLLIRFSDVGTYDIWIAAVGNQAGSYRLSRGSRIMGAIQAPQTTLIFTDTDVWSMSYIGPPLIYGFTIMGTGCGLVAPHAVVTLGRTTYWRGADGFWKFGDSGVQSMECSVWDYAFLDLDTDNINKCHAGANSYSDEVTFYHPSLSEPYRRGVEEIEGTVLSNEPDHYVKMNTNGPAWDKGVLGRTAWINTNIFGPPLGADLNYRVQQHETGFDDDDQPMRGVFAETGYSEIGDGTVIPMVDQCQPDFKWFGKNGGVNLTLKSLSYAGSKPRSHGPWSMTETTQFFNPRARGRHVAVRFDWVARRGFSARLGATLMRFKPAGKRP
jgi:hypothetical protein